MGEFHNGLRHLDALSTLSPGGCRSASHSLTSSLGCHLGAFVVSLSWASRLRAFGPWMVGATNLHPPPPLAGAVARSTTLRRGANAVSEENNGVSVRLGSPSRTTAFTCRVGNSLPRNPVSVGIRTFFRLLPYQLPSNEAAGVRASQQRRHERRLITAAVSNQRAQPSFVG